MTHTQSLTAKKILFTLLNISIIFQFVLQIGYFTISQIYYSQAIAQSLQIQENTPQEEPWTYTEYGLFFIFLLVLLQCILLFSYTQIHLVHMIKNILECFNWEAAQRNINQRPFSYQQDRNNFYCNRFFHHICHTIYYIIVSLLLTVCSILFFFLQFTVVGFKFLMLSSIKKKQKRQQCMNIGYLTSFLEITVITTLVFLNQHSIDSHYPDQKITILWVGTLSSEFISLILMITNIIYNHHEKNQQSRQMSILKAKLNQSLLGSNRCIWCKIEKRKVLLEPCGCLYYCQKCADRIVQNDQVCLKCDAEVSHALRIYIS